MRRLADFRHLILVASLDAVLANIGLFAGSLVRYIVLLALAYAPKSLFSYATLNYLWADSLQSYMYAVPSLTASCLLVFAFVGFYKRSSAYHARNTWSILQAGTVAFLIFGLASYAIMLLGYVSGWSAFSPFPRSALFAGWAITLGLLLLARHAASILDLASEGRLTGQLLRNRYFFLSDLGLVVFAAWLSFVARLDPSQVEMYRVALVVYMVGALAVKLIVFQLFGLYRRYWRYAGLAEAITIVEANLVATLGMIVFAYLIAPVFLNFESVPRSIPFIDFLIATVSIGGVRFLVRLLGDRRIMSRLGHDFKAVPASARRILILGAGDAGVMIAKEMQANPQLGLEPIVFLDDDPCKHATRILGIPVVGNRYRIAQAVNEYQITEAIIAIPTAPGKTVRELTRLCQDAKVPVKTVPGIFELLNGSVTVSQLREVDITDLLRREPVETDVTQVVQSLAGKAVLVTGAGGSIGSELCRQIARCHPARLVLLGHGENSIFDIFNELKRTESANSPKGQPKCFYPVIADIRDAERMHEIFKWHRPQIVFHAAAHKHVPLMEENVEDAISNNVQGTRQLLACAEAWQVEQLVLISTDKAVNPTSIMGATKRIAELLVQEAAERTGRRFVAVRFGNVLGSRGSVVPFLKQQIVRGGPVTITHPEVQRYFMTIPEAVQLVLQAGSLGKGGEIFVLDMGKPVKILDLARDLIRLSGLEEGRDIDIAFTGLRPGEKLYEELFASSEKNERTAHEKILVVHNGMPKQHASVTPLENLHTSVDGLLAACRKGDATQARHLLQSIVPEYRLPEPGESQAPGSVSTAADAAPISMHPAAHPVKG